MNIKEFSSFFHPQYKEILERHIKDCASQTNVNVIHETLEHTQKIALAGAKYIRPYLVYLMYNAQGGSDKKDIISFASGVEMFHLFCLVHDDIFDRGQMRRGIPTLHTQFAEPIAVLIGDLLLSWAHDEFSKYSEEGVLNNILAQMKNEVVIGEIMDVLLAKADYATHADIIKKTELKTAYYTFVRPMQEGVALAGGSFEKLKWCEEFGNALGMAFQLRDDMLDVVDTTGLKNKQMGDLQEGQQTLFTYAIQEFGTEAQKIELAKMYGTILSDEEIIVARQLFRDSGAIAYVAKCTNEYFDTAEKLLADWPFDMEWKKYIIDLLSSLREGFDEMSEPVT
ncbi:MAG: polyprenyl synthetase family protein [bacterium]|nr:polyprenyl synthetase family protein [bacterium]